MRINFSSLSTRALILTTVFTIALVGSIMGVSHTYWKQKQEAEHYLMQQQTINFCLQDLDNSVFYSRISELSNLSIIRNELYRIYRMIDLSAQYTHMSELKAAESYARSALIAPSPDPRSLSVSTDNVELHFTKNHSNHPATDHDVKETNIKDAATQVDDINNLTNPLLEKKQDNQSSLNFDSEKALMDLFAMEQDKILIANENVNSSYLSDLRDTATLLQDSTDISIIDAIDRAQQKTRQAALAKGESLKPNNEAQIQEQNQENALNQAFNELYKKNKVKEAPAAPTAKPTTPSAEPIAPNSTNAAPKNTKEEHSYSEYLDFYPTDDASYIRELKTKYAFKIHDVITSNHLSNRYNNGFRTNFKYEGISPLQTKVLGADLNDFNSNRIKVYNHLSLLSKLGFTAFSINLADPDLDIFTKSRDRLLLSSLKGDQNDLNHIIYNNSKVNGTFFVILRDQASTANNNLNNYLDKDGPKIFNRFTGHFATSHFDTNTSIQLDNEHNHVFDTNQLQDISLNANLNDQNVEHNDKYAKAAQNSKLKPRSAASIAALHESTLNNNNKAQNANSTIGNITNSDSGHGKIFLALVAPLSLGSDQLLVIITEISKLKQQEETLKRLIANSLNEMIVANSLTMPTKITLVNKDLYPLAGSLTSKTEVMSLVDKELLKDSRSKGVIQFYDTKSDQYVSIGAFKYYDWYLVLSCNSNSSITELYDFLSYIALVGLVLFALAFISVLYITKKDIGDITNINNKIKHVATNINDPVLLQRICENIPKRNDEIGALASTVRLMSKTVYQSIQEILQINKEKDLHSEDYNLLSQLRSQAVNKDILLREYYNSYLDAHTESASLTKVSDFYDAFELSSSKLVILVGSLNDSSLMSTYISHINIGLMRQLIRLNESIKLPLAHSMQELNKNIADNNPKSILTSVCIMIIDRKSGEVEYFNAGHNLPIVYRANQGFDYIECRTAPVIGAHTAQQFRSINFNLEPGDSILLYSDGVLDCTNAKLEKLGQEGFENMLHDENFLSPIETVNSLNNKLKKFTKGGSHTKDYTLLCYQFTKNQTTNENSKPQF